MLLNIDVKHLNVNDLRAQLPLLAAGLQARTVGFYHGHLVSKGDNPSLASPTYLQLNKVVREAEKLLKDSPSDKLKESLEIIRKYADESRGFSREKGKLAQFLESLANVLGNTFK